MAKGHGILTTTAKSVENKDLKSLTNNVKPISVKERKARIAKAQQLMQKHNIAAMILEPGAAMDYFSGIQWWRSERLTAVVIPKEGEIAVVCPFFEEPSIRESLAVGEDVRVWQEHESPFERVKQILYDRKSPKAPSPLKIRCAILCSGRSCRCYPICKILALSLLPWAAACLKTHTNYN